MTSPATGPAQTMAAFLEGPSNRLALAAARRVARGDDDVNPLVIVAARGLGKSHLLQAIRQQAEAAHPDWHVEYETLNGLVERAHGERGGVVPLHECHLLLLDGLERLAERPDLVPLVQELVDGRVPFRRAMVVASAVPPLALGDEALGRALSAGVVVEISAPDPGTRLAILRRRASELRPALADEVLTSVATLPFPSVRELLAALQRLVAFQAVSPAPLDPEQARILIGGGLEPEVEAAPVGEARAVAASGPPAGTPGDDEFGSFLSEVVASVGHQVDRWRAQVGEAVLRYGGEGYRTQRLEALLEQEMPGGPGEALAEFAGRIERLRAMEQEAVALMPELEGAPAFRDPERLGEAEALLWQARRRRDPLPAPALTYRMERLGEGPANRMALQAARAVIESPGAKYNPLVILGPSGTGKSHLLNAVGNALAERGVEGVACLGAAAFAAEAEAAGADRAAWRARYRYAGALLVDDLAGLAGRPAAQEELLGIVDACLETGRQVVCTAPGPLATLHGVDPRLLTRLEAGLVAELARPDRDVRRAVIRQLLSGTAAEGDAALADWLADRPADSVRAVQGMVRRVLGAAEAAGVAPSPALAREVLERRPTARPAVRASDAHRAPGLPATPAGLARSGEKMVHEWPRLADRLLEEYG